MGPDAGCGNDRHVGERRGDCICDLPRRTGEDAPSFPVVRERAHVSPLDATGIGREDHAGARDVGAALARNPFPIIVPCHRVLAANGRLHGFSAPGGLETKRRMLELEGAPGFGQQALFG